MTHPEDPGDLDVLTDEEHDALGAFGDLVEVSCASTEELVSEAGRSTQFPTHIETKERGMIRRNFRQLVAAASIIAALGVGISGMLREDEQPREAHPLTWLAPQETGPRMTLLIGLDDLGSGRTPPVLEFRSGPVGSRPEGGADGTEDTYTAFTFDRKAADAQRQAAIEAGRADPKGYKPGQSFQLIGKDGNGKRKMPVYWKPWAPGAIARDKKVAVADAVRALKAARIGEEFDAALVEGGWVYAPPRWYGPQKPGFTERTFVNAKVARTQRGGWGVVADIAEALQADFKEFTGAYVGHPLCHVADDMVWSNPSLNEALTDALMFSGGGDGFDLDEANYMLRVVTGGTNK